MTLLLLHVHKSPTSAPNVDDFLLMETGEFLLLETNDKIILDD